VEYSVLVVGVRTDHDRDPAGLRSDVYWALLGLIIARPSYGYELTQRYERTYGELWPLSSPGQIYKGLDSLEEKGLIEKAPGGGDPDRQPKMHYRTTSRGLELYESRLVARAAEEAKRSREWGHELAALPSEAALVVLDSYERRCLEEAERTRPTERRDHAGENGEDLAARLAAEDTRLILEAKLSWIARARCELRALLGRRTGRP
jgi:DNA-binding PadR family transcriptional regulator